MLTGNARSPQPEPVRTRIPDGLKFSPFSSRRKFRPRRNPKVGKILELRKCVPVVQSVPLPRVIERTPEVGEEVLHGEHGARGPYEKGVFLTSLLRTFPLGSGSPSSTPLGRFLAEHELPGLRIWAEPHLLKIYHFVRGESTDELDTS